MYKTGHYGAALLLYAPVGFLLLVVDPALSVLGGLGTVALCRLPDYDMRVPGISHRGVTHTVAFGVLVSAVTGAVGLALADVLGTPPSHTALVGVVVGGVAVGSHLLADVLTPAGVPLLWPLSGHRFSVNVARASNPLANYGLLALGVTATLGFAYLSSSL